MAFRQKYKNLAVEEKRGTLTTTGKRLADAMVALAPPAPKVSALTVRSILAPKAMVTGRVPPPPHPRNVFSRAADHVVKPSTEYFGEPSRLDTSRPEAALLAPSIRTESEYEPVRDVIGMRRGLLAIPLRRFDTSMVPPFPGASSGLTRETPMMKEKRDTESATIARRYAVSKGIAAEKLAKVVAAEDQLKQDAASAEASAAYKEAKRLYERDVLGRD